MTDHDDPAPLEPDPTGMRDLLARLPGPGPMPQDLVARITAALEVEASGRAVTPPKVVPGAVPSPDAVPSRDAVPRGRVVPLPRRRSPLRHLGVAAAVVGILGLGTYGVGALQGLGSVLPSGGSDDSADSSAGAAQEGSAAESAPEGEAGGVGPTASDTALRAAPAPGSGEVVVVMSGRDYDTAGLAAAAAELAASALTPLPDGAAEAPSLGPIATPIGARTCASALGVEPSAGLLVDLADVDGRPAAVLVVIEDGGRTASVVERSCTTGTTSPVSGPVALE